MTPPSIRELQEPLRKAYKDDPGSAPRTLVVRSVASDLGDPLLCRIAPDSTPDTVWSSGAHPAVGGTGDAPCSGDLLLASLAACQEVTIRMVAANQGIELRSLEVVVEGDWDPRGTLAMGREFPVGITAIRCSTRVELADDVTPERAERLLKSAERFCVVLSTLRSGPDVSSDFSLGG